MAGVRSPEEFLNWDCLEWALLPVAPNSLLDTYLYSLSLLPLSGSV